MEEQVSFRVSKYRLVVRMASPPWTSLRELEQASLRLEADDAINDPNYINWLTMLLAPGSSLGGARPKASVVDKVKHLWIAKFPSNHDEKDVGGGVGDGSE